MPRKPDLSIIGKTFGDLEVLEYTDKRNSYNRGLYRCRCKLCGGERLATRANLIRGGVKNCGCKNHDPKYNLVGQTFGHCKVISTTIVNNKLHYVCECLLCGNTFSAMPYKLKSGNTQSCGCLQRQAVKSLYVADTAPCKLTESQKPRITNTSGTTGVWYDRSRGAWVAEIMFRGKKYFLGRRVIKEDAIKLRKQAEKQIFGEFLDWYEDFKNGKSD